MRPYITVVRELSPVEWLPILRTDLVVAQGYVQSARRTGQYLPGYEARVSKLDARIRELEAMGDGMVMDSAVADSGVATKQDTEVSRYPSVLDAAE